MLRTLSGRPSQVRWSSSDSQTPSQQSSQQLSNKQADVSENSQDNNTPSSFGFQSLAGLFQTPEPQRRYSGPAESSNDNDLLRHSKHPVTSGRFDGTTKRQVNDGFFESSSPSQSNNSELASETRHSALPHNGKEDSLQSTADNQPASIEESVQTAQARKGGRHKSIRVRRYISPDQENFLRKEAFALHHHRGASAISSNPRAAVKLPSSGLVAPRRPWGLSRVVRRVESESESSLVQASLNQINDVLSSPVCRPEAKAQEIRGQNLTHVNSSGEAYMVDVGEKASTRRVAIATTVVIFSNPEPFRLTFENTNKKGDVLGVARIAGIMAAKRTSDLIPLCHPITISKTEVEAKLGPPGAGKAGLYPKSAYGVVYIQALVECVGPTGVEMEALSAASAAALTVFDMCKAVDRQMKIGMTRVVYKSGGRSGLFYDGKWAVDSSFFVERGLEVPKALLKGGRSEKDET